MYIYTYTCMKEYKNICDSAWVLDYLRIGSVAAMLTEQYQSIHCISRE